MKKLFVKVVVLTCAFVMIFSFAGCDTPNDDKIKNVILMIGDGMGPEQIRAGEFFKGEKLFLQGIAQQTTVETRSASSSVTDSAAAATAMATGTRTTNGVIGKNTDLTDLETIVDIASRQGKRTGIITTEELFGATPMSFAAHSNSRSNSDELLQSAATTSNVNLFASYNISDRKKQYFLNAGYKTPDNVDQISEMTDEKVFGTFDIKASAPSMTANEKTSFDRLVTEALEYLSQDEDGFFLMAEGAHIDHGGHNNDIKYMLEELLAFDDAVKAAVNWANDRKDTVVIVVADHETGGLKLDDDITHEKITNDYLTNLDSCFEWTTSGHTQTPVNCYISGTTVDLNKYQTDKPNQIKNTDVFLIMKSLIEPQAQTN